MAERKGLRTFRPPVKPAARLYRACASFAVAHRTRYQGFSSTFTTHIKKAPLRVLLMAERKGFEPLIGFDTYT